MNSKTKVLSDLLRFWNIIMEKKKARKPDSLLCFNMQYILLVTSMFCIFSTTVEATTVTALNNGNPYTQIPGGGFESPQIPLGTCSPAVNNLNWTYNGNARVASNGSFCNANNPNAPEGSQVLFILNGGQASTNLSVSPGMYRLSLRTMMAKSIPPFYTGPQDVIIKVDGEEIYRYTPSTVGYRNLITPIFALPLGTETLEIIADCCRLSAPGTLIDDIKLQAAPLWSDPGTWDSNSVPTAQDDVVIPGKAVVVLNTNANVKSIHLNGRFYALNGVDLTLSLNYFLVDGRNALLQWGSENKPYLNRGIINLNTNNTTQDIKDLGTKFIAAINRGRLEIHGAPRLSWTQLGVTANQGAQSITVKETTDWKVGDEIVIASTDFNVHQTEVRVITSVSNNGKTFGFSLALQHEHFGDIQYYKNGTLALDERAEVGLLSRNITIQGTGWSAQTGFGGHMLVRHLAKARISGVELYKMGQKSELGRYPFHWHHAHDATGQYIKNSSIHRSFNRVITVHRTNNTVVEDNVGFMHIGHGYFLEDASETGNTFHHNLGLMTLKPAEGEEVHPHDRVQERHISIFKLPATFWITNPKNYFTDNAAAGSEGSGFWFTAQDAVISGNPVSDPPKNNPIGAFDNNRAHSNDHSNFAIDGQVKVEDGEEVFKVGHYAPMVNGQQHIPIITNFTSFKARSRGLWTRANTMYFDNCALANNNTNTFFAFNQVLRNSLSVGASANIGKLTTIHEINAGHSIPLPGLPFTHNRNKLNGHILYDGSSGIENVHFAGFNGDSNGTYCIGISGAARKSPVHWSENISFEPGIPQNAKVDFRLAPYFDNVFSTGLIDRDGTVLGAPNTRLVPKIRHYGTDDSLAVREPGFNTEVGDPENVVWNAVTTSNLDVATIYWRSFWPNGNFSPSYFMRFDGQPNQIFGASYATLGDHAVANSIHQPSVFTDNPRTYYWQYHRLPNRAFFQLQFAEQNDRMISAFPNIPSSLYVRYQGGGGPAKASGFYDLMNSSQEKYFIKDNVLYINHLATQGGVDPQYGHDHSYKSKLIRLCLEQNCSNNEPGLTEGVVFADFETGINSKSTVQGFGLPDPTVNTSVTNPITAPFDQIDDYTSYQVVSDADGTNDYIEFSMSFTRQLWTHFDFLKIHLEGAPFHVYVKNGGDPLTFLGQYNPPSGKASIPLASLDKDDRDHIRKLHIRVYEADLGSLTLPGVSALVKLFHIGLDVDTGTRSRNLDTDLKESENALSLKALKIFPNPTSAEFTIATELAKDVPVSVSVYNVLGMKVAHWAEKVPSGTWSKTFNTTDWHLESGTYFIVVRTPDSQRKSSLIVIKP